MTAETLVDFEFRCTSCWQPLRASIESAGDPTECRWCHQTIEIPEATENRIQRAVEAAEPDVEVEAVEYETEPLSRDQIASIATERALAKASSRPGYSTPESMAQAGRLTRLFAVMIDSLILGLAAGAGIALLVVLGSAGLIDMDPNQRPPESLAEVPWQALGVVLFFPFAVSFINWNLIATQGQSIGKKLCGIRIVDDLGNPPGFFRGVIIRNWIRNFLGSFIPFFSLIDTLFIFSDPPRCVHDRMAGTFVVNAKA